jgi:hypothetical protein
VFEEMHKGGNRKPSSGCDGIDAGQGKAKVVDVGLIDD